MITKSKNKIRLNFEGLFPKNKNIELSIQKIKNKNLKTTKEYIEYILKITKNDIKNEQIKKIIDNIISKIPDDFIDNLINLR